MSRIVALLVGLLVVAIIFLSGPIVFTIWSLLPVLAVILLVLGIIILFLK